MTEVRADGLVCRVGAPRPGGGARAEHAPAVGDDVHVMVRPERVEMLPARRQARPETAERTNIVPGKVVALVFRGAHTGVILDCDGIGVEAEVANHRGEPPHWLTTGSAVRAKVRRLPCGCW